MNDMINGRWIDGWMGGLMNLWMDGWRDMHIQLEVVSV